jgi:hypothetical protein
MPAEVTVYRCGPDNKAIPVDTHDHSPSGCLGWDLKALTAPNGPGFDPEDVLKRLDDLAGRIEKLEQELIGLATLMSKISPRRIERLEKEMQSLLENSPD